MREIIYLTEKLQKSQKVPIHRKSTNSPTKSANSPTKSRDSPTKSLDSSGNLVKIPNILKTESAIEAKNTVANTLEKIDKSKYALKSMKLKHS